MSLVNLLTILYPTLKNGVDYNVSTINDEETITDWTSEEIPKPSNTELSAQLVSYNLQISQQVAKMNQLASMPDPREQLLMIYNDSLNGTKTWKTAIEAVITANPIPTS